MAQSAAYISLKEYLEMRLLEVEKARAVAYQTMERRLEGMNEFRDTLRDQAARFMTREEYMLALKPIEEDIRSLRETRAALQGKANQSALNLTLGLSVLGTLLAVVSIVLRLLGK